MLSAPMQRLRQLALDDASLRERLRAPLDDAGFVQVALAVAAHHGIPLTEQEVRHALDAGRREWLERWI